LRVIEKKKKLSISAVAGPQTLYYPLV